MKIRKQTLKGEYRRRSKMWRSFIQIKRKLMTGYTKHDTPYCSRAHKTEEKARKQAQLYFEKHKFSEKRYEILVYKSCI